MGNECSCYRDARESGEEIKDNIETNLRRMRGKTPPKGESIKYLTLTTGYDPRMRQTNLIGDDLSLNLNQPQNINYFRENVPVIQGGSLQTIRTQGSMNSPPSQPFLYRNF